MEAGTDQASNVTSFIHATNHDREGQPGFPPSEAKKSEDVAPTQSMSLGSESSSDVKGTAAEERALLLCRSSKTSSAPWLGLISASHGCFKMHAYRDSQVVHVRK